MRNFSKTLRLLCSRTRDKGYGSLLEGIKDKIKVRFFLVQFFPLRGNILFSRKGGEGVLLKRTMQNVTFRYYENMFFAWINVHKVILRDPQSRSISISVRKLVDRSKPNWGAKLCSTEQLFTRTKRKPSLSTPRLNLSARIQRKDYF